MDFSLNEEQAALQATAKRFAETELRDIATTVEHEDQPPGQDVLRRFAEMGLLGINLEPELGGAGAGHLEAVLVLEEIAKISPAVAFPVFESCFGPILAIQH
ncbi:MAG: acyl-CoA dehydrogenase family protein, partial [Pseudomonadota bacterium]